MNPQKRIARSLLRYGDSLRGGKYTDMDAANTLVSNNATAMLLGVLFDQGIPYEKAWEAPYRLKQRLGHLDIRRLARTPVRRLREAVQGDGDEPSLHRFVGKMPRWIKQACGQIVKDYDGEPSRMWDECFSAGEVIERFDELTGFGKKKANLAARIIHESWQPLRRWHEINMAVDVHVRRVWKRAGLVQDTSPNVIMRKASELNPKFPGRLDYPTWIIGMGWCHPGTPDCKGKEKDADGPCPLRTCCPTGTPRAKRR